MIPKDCFGSAAVLPPLNHDMKELDPVDSFSVVEMPGAS